MADAPTYQELDLLAAEYVLGVMPTDERHRFALLIESDATPAMLVAHWSEQLARLNLLYRPVAPPDVIRAVESRLFGEMRRRKQRVIGLGMLFFVLAVGKAFGWLWLLGLL